MDRAAASYSFFCFCGKLLLFKGGLSAGAGAFYLGQYRLFVQSDSLYGLVHSDRSQKLAAKAFRVLFYYDGGSRHDLHRNRN